MSVAPEIATALACLVTSWEGGVGGRISSHAGPPSSMPWAGNTLKGFTTNHLSSHTNHLSSHTGPRSVTLEGITGSHISLHILTRWGPAARCDAQRATEKNHKYM